MAQASRARRGGAHYYSRGKSLSICIARRRLVVENDASGCSPSKRSHSYRSHSHATPHSPHTRTRARRVHSADGHYPPAAPPTRPHAPFIYFICSHLGSGNPLHTHFHNQIAYLRIDLHTTRHTPTLSHSPTHTTHNTQAHNTSCFFGRRPAPHQPPRPAPTPTVLPRPQHTTTAERCVDRRGGAWQDASDGRRIIALSEEESRGHVHAAIWTAVRRWKRAG